MAVVNLGRDTSGRMLKMDDRMLAKQRLAEERLGFELTIVQGSYMAGEGADASAGYHDKGGTADYRTWDIPASIGVDRVVRELRRAGIIAWYRTEAQGFDPHIHAVDYGNPNLSSGATSQVLAWKQGRNGLASNGPDDGPRVDIPQDPPKEDDMAWDDKFDAWEPGDKNTADQMRASQQLNQARGYAKAAFDTARRTEAKVDALLKELRKK